MKRRRAAIFPTALLAASSLAVFACAVNPATGRRQFMLISEGQEIAMGQQYDPEIVASMGLFGGGEWQNYMQQIGRRMAARTERPNLPWTFRVIDDPVVNAFAVPGGYVYITRGILAHFNSEAQLAAVMGHEIAHVTARHSAAQMSTQTLLQGAVGVGALLAPELQTVFGLASAGLGVLFLKHSRDDETEADQLGLGYMFADGYDPRPMPEVYAMLGQISASAGGGPPEWLSTHPNPANREQRIRTLMAQLPSQDFASRTINASGYLARLEGMIYGENPRHGFFDNNVFKHPDLVFEVAFPPGWRMQNQPSAVVGISSEENAMMQLSFSEHATPTEAAQAWFAQDGVSGNVAPFTDNVVSGLRGAFVATTADGAVPGYATFLSYGGQVYQLLGYGNDAGWGTYGAAVQAGMASFRRLTDQQALNVQPNRITIQATDISTNLRIFNRRFPSVVPVEELALLNQVGLNETIPAGTELKRVTN